MAVSQRLKAQNILFKIGGVDYACDANMVELTLNDAPGGVRTFCEVRVYGEWKLQLDGITSLESTSLYQLLFANYGTEVAFVVAPAGNATASSTEPHYTGTVIFDELPPMTLNAGEEAAFSVQLTVVNDVHDPATGVFYGLTKDTSA